MRAPQALIRNPGSDRDWVKVREICCRTANNGAPIERERWPFFGDFWIGPYQRLLPSWTYLVELDGEVRGYLSGCPDTTRFERRKRYHFRLPLLLAVLSGKYPRNADVKKFVRRTLRLEKSPEQCFSRATRVALAREYPAHLHVNIDESSRGMGLGKKMIEHFSVDLRRFKASGIHVYCGSGPLEFYRSLGFSELASIEYRARGAKAPVRVYALGLALPSLT